VAAATRAGQLEAARLLLAAGARVDKACEGSPPLHVAVGVGPLPGQRGFALEATRLLLEHGAVPFERCGSHWAAVP
jgi:hypothetical protein